MGRPASSETDNERRQEILRAAGEIFADRGIANTTVRDIGAKVGILSGSLYYHFRSKDDMVIELLDRELTELVERMQRAMEGREPLDALRASIREAVHHAAEKPTAIRIMRNNVSYLRTNPALAGVEKLRQSNRLMWIGLVKACIASGQMRSDVNPDMVVRAMWDSVMGTPRWFPPQGRRRPDAVADQLISLFLDGLLVK